MADEPQGLFRKEALDQLEAGAKASLLRISPAWTRWTYWLVVSIVLGALVYSAIGTIDEYASGPVLIRADGRREVTALNPGTVAALDVHPGERVARGQILVHFDDANENAEFERLERQFELQLVKTLRDPSDQAARQSLIALRAQKELAQVRLDERTVRAPADGMVSDVRIRAGQHLSAGEIILVLVQPDASFSAVAMLPGQYRPLLRAGMPLRLEVEGYRYQYQHLTVEQVSDEVVGPAEVRRYLGEGVGDAVQISGPVVIVKGRLASPTFQVDGQPVRFHDGMLARGEVAVRTERIAIALVPGLRALVRR